jgi:hypothetical protein
MDMYCFALRVGVVNQFFRLLWIIVCFLWKMFIVESPWMEILQNPKPTSTKQDLCNGVDTSKSIVSRFIDVKKR